VILDAARCWLVLSLLLLLLLLLLLPLLLLPLLALARYRMLPLLRLARAAARVAAESARRTSWGCFGNPSASAAQFARRRDPARLGKLQTLACNL